MNDRTASALRRHSSRSSQRFSSISPQPRRVHYPTGEVALVDGRLTVRTLTSPRSSYRPPSAAAGCPPSGERLAEGRWQRHDR
jgi:hypothetical protein